MIRKYHELLIFFYFLPTAIYLYFIVAVGDFFYIIGFFLWACYYLEKSLSFIVISIIMTLTLIFNVNGSIASL